MTQKGSEVRTVCEWRGHGYKRNRCESCPAKQLKCIIPSRRGGKGEKTTKVTASLLQMLGTYGDLHCAPRYAGVSGTPGKETSCIHLILVKSPSRSEFLPSSGGCQGWDFSSSHFYQLKQKENETWLLRQNHFQGNTDLCRVQWFS